MKKLLSVLTLVALALAGCGAEDPGSGNSNTGVGNPTPGDDTGVKQGALVVIHAYAPEGLVGDFVFGDGDDFTIVDYYLCKNASDCEVIWDPVKRTLVPRVPCLKGDISCDHGFGSSGKDVYVVFTCPGHAFVRLKFNATTAGTDKPYEVRWDFPGAWGLAPNGMYSQIDGDEVKIATAYDYTLDRIVIKGMQIDAIVDGANVSGKKNAVTINGSIASDLKIITYHLDVEGGDAYDETLTLIE